MALKVPGPFSHPSGAQMREFRLAVARLKFEGLIPPNSRGRNVQPSKARPGDMFGGMSLRDRVNRYKEVAQGNAVTIARSRVGDTQGFQVASKGLKGKDRVIVPLPKDAKLTVEDKQIVIRHPLAATGSVKRTMLPRKDLKTYLSEAKDLPELRGNKWYAFYAYHGKSKEIFRTPGLLREYLAHYEPIRNPTAKNQRDFFRHFEIVEIEGAEKKRTWQERETRHHRGKKQTYADVKKRFQAAPPAIQEKIRQQRRESAARWRANKALKSKSKSGRKSLKKKR